MNYPKAIKLARVKAGLTQKQLAAKMNMNASYISRIEAGRKSPTIETLTLIADWLGITFPLLTLIAAEEADLIGITPKLKDEIALVLADILICRRNLHLLD